MKKLLTILTLLLFAITSSWAEDAVPTVPGTYSFGSTSIGGSNKFGELSENSVFVYRNSNYSSSQSGIKANAGNNSGFVFYLTSTMTLTATVYQNSSTSETVTLNIKTVTSSFFNELVNGTANSTTVSAPTLTDYRTASASGPTSKNEFTVDGGILAPGYYYVYVTSSAKSVNTYHRAISLASAGPQTPTFSLTKDVIGVGETSQIQVGSEGSLDGIPFTIGYPTFTTEDIVSVDENGVVTGLSSGTTTIKFKTDEVEDRYNGISEEQSLTITVKEASDLTLSSLTEDITKNGSPVDVSYTTSSTGAVTVESNNISVATVTVNESTKTITITPVTDATGSAKIIVSQEADASHLASEKTINVTVYNAAEYYTLSTITTSIPLNKTNILAQDYLATTQDKWSSDKYEFDGLDSDNFFEMSSVGRDLTLKVVGVSAFVVRNSNGGGAERTYGVSVGDEELATVTVSANSQESSQVFLTGTTSPITIKLSGKGTGTTRPIRIILYQSVEEVSVSAAGLATYASDYNLDFSEVTGIKAYKASIAGKTITFEKVDEVPAGEGMLIRAMSDLDAEKTFYVPHKASASPIENAMKRGENAAVIYHPSDNIYNYVLSGGDNGVGFYQANGETVPRDHAYLQSTAALAKGFVINYDDEEGEETDGIKAVSTKVENGVRYNLAGQKVGADYKGIVIVNGKKVIIK